MLYIKLDYILRYRHVFSRNNIIPFFTFTIKVKAAVHNKQEQPKALWPIET